MADIKTRFLIISDTHADQKLRLPTLQGVDVDVAIHCGDLIVGSKIAEYHTTLDLLQAINAPLKLVIAGNHDFTLDTPMYQKKAAEAHRIFSIDPALMSKEYGDFGGARSLNEKGYLHTSHCTGDGHPIILGKSTLFVNAAVEPAPGDEGQQLPWIVDLELPPQVS